MRRIYFNLVKLEKEIYFIEILWILITFRWARPGLLTKKGKEIWQHNSHQSSSTNITYEGCKWPKFSWCYCIPGTTLIQFKWPHIMFTFFSTYMFSIRILFHPDPSGEYKCMLILHAYFKQGASNHNLNRKHSILYWI